MAKNQLRCHVVLSMPFAENTYVAHLDGSRDCVIFDPGLEPEKIVQCVADHQLKPAAILNTHGHADHIAGNHAMKQEWPDCPLIIGTGDAAKLTDPAANLSAAYGMRLISPEADRLVNDGDTISLAGFDLEVIETPGHSAGHVVFLWKAGDPWMVFGGDVLFQLGIGRYDFPDSDHRQLYDSICNKLFKFPDDTVVLPGHGEATTIGHERRFNPFVGESARD